MSEDVKFGILKICVGVFVGAWILMPAFVAGLL